MTTLNRVILTGENEEIVPLTAEEIALIEHSKLETAKEKAALSEAVAAAQAAKEVAIAKLEALGLTNDDLKALGL
jgi:hypothetical protein